MSIKGEQQARLTALQFRLQALESAFGYEERPLHRAVMTPKSYGTSGRIKDRLEFGKFSIGQAARCALFGVMSRSTTWTHRIKSQSGRHRRSRRVRFHERGATKGRVV